MREDSGYHREAGCVWEGNGKVEISVYHQDSGAEVIDFDTTLKPEQARIGNFKIHLSDLQLYPKISKENNPEDYKNHVLIKKV